MTTPMTLALHLLTLLILPPLLLGVINKVKAWFAGRRGPPLLQAYFDLLRLLRKGAVYSRTTTWVFRAGPIVGLATALVAGLLVPLAGGRGLVGFEGDVIAFAALFGLGRFFTMAAALDTGSSFEGMGASREASLSALAEPALFLALASICLPAKALSFQAALYSLPATSWGFSHPMYLLTAFSLFVVLLAESSRIPFDDPNTHLELTMIHEVMVLDHSGPDFAFIGYGAALKLLAGGALLVQVLFPGLAHLSPAYAAPAMAAGLVLVAAAIGVVESTMARLRLLRLPQLLVSAAVLSFVVVAMLFYQGAP